MSELALYHNGMSSCSQKVRLVLAEKGLSFTSHVIDLVGGEQHASDYVKLNPDHVVPTLVHDGRVLVESSLIDEYLDETFAEPALRPPDPTGRHAMRLWVKRIDEKVHPAAGVLTYAVGVRAGLLAQPDETRRRHVESIPDPQRRAQRASVLEHGVHAPEFAGALGRFIDLVDDMERALARDPWLSGPRFGLADVSALPYVLRMVHLGLYPLLAPGARPRVADWLARVEARPSFETAVAAWAPAPILDLFRKQGEALWPEIEPMTRGERTGAA